ncbi:hypothetical protein D8682_25275 [Buttiauxella sp. 3AFRM03]|uniref:hypothetical protein n=1 Tax=Buttiauxella sp. 3AFRM03 TaxID=2479367 RepID=UPI000EF84539|nr:hypothetical protein [Buttiauxella sp. 3AFRM03]AYN29997.1 hypothetical protein D8682_25275 [Buttiauxella sp. 3AFRM03]
MTVEEIKEMRDAARAALRDAMDAQSVSFGGVNNRSVTRQSIKELEDIFLRWDRRYKNATGGGGKSYSRVRFRSD